MQHNSTTTPAVGTSMQRHSTFEDIQALVTGTLLVSLGVTLLGEARLITGGTVGIAFLLHYLSGFPFGPLFFAVNLPFYWLAVRKMGWAFTLKTFAAVALLSLFSGMVPRVLALQRLDPLYAAVMGGLLCGVGLLALFRHKASLGGLNVLVLWLQERFGLRAGYVQLAIDAMILLLSVPLISLKLAATSLIGAVALNLALAVNHRPGRYMAI